MKHVFALILVAVIGVFIFGALYIANIDEAVSFTEYGDVNLGTRLSSYYIDKSVTEADGVSNYVEYKKSEGLEDGSANYVTSIVVNYRSFDTLGEITVLFISALGVSLLLGGKRERKSFAGKPNFILKHGSHFVFALMMLFGVYMFTHGHLTPGGGFPGGSIMAASILLLYMSDNEFRVKLDSLKVAEGMSGSLYVIVGLLGIVLGGYFLYNFLPTGVVGEVISAGVIPIVYILIGLKVGSELSSVIDSFLTQEVAE